MKANPLGAVVVGAGQAGLATSYHLKRHGIEHVLLERGSLGATWQTQRWDSFVLTTPSHLNCLPGVPFYPATPDSFESGANLVRYFEHYAQATELPLRTNAPVISARRLNDTDLIEVETSTEKFVTKNLVAASGSQNVPRYPGIASSCPPSINSIHTADYRNPSQLPSGNVLVVGSAKSGSQIVEELLESDRKTYLATSRVGRVRRRMRGLDVAEWMQRIGYWSETAEDLHDSGHHLESQPLVSGNNGGHTLSLQSLWRAGVTLLGRIESFQGSRAVFQRNLRDNISYADAFSQGMTRRIEAVAKRLEPDSPPLGPDPADDVDQEALGIPPVTEIDLQECGITTIIWATGFRGDYGWLCIDGALNDSGGPSHESGVSSANGVYFVGMPWLRTRSSAIIYGADSDGACIADHIAARV